MNAESPGQTLSRAAVSLSEAYWPKPEPRSAQDHSRECERRLSKLEVELPAEYRSILQYHRARLLALAGDKNQAVGLLDALLKEIAPAPEVIWLKIQSGPPDESEEAARLRWRQEERLGTLLPLSTWGSLRDLALERQEAERAHIPAVDSPWPAIPRLDRGKLLRIAELYDEMDLCAEAASAYREAVYCGFGPPEFPKPGPETWISAEVADLWVRAARSEAAIRRNRQAVHAVFMAVASEPKHAQTASALLARTFDGKPEIRERKPDAQKLTEIARLYCECNVHPRAVQALDEAAKIPGIDVSAQRKKTEADWERLVNEYRQGREGTCFLFGRKVTETPNRLDLSPPPLAR